MDRERSPTEGSFVPPSQFPSSRQQRQEPTPCKSIATNPTERAEEMVPIEISLVVRFRNRFGQEIRTEKDVVLTREDFERFQIQPQVGYQHKTRNDTDYDQRSVFAGMESHVTNNLQLYEPRESRNYTQSNLPPPEQPAEVVRPMKLPGFTTNFKKVVGAECAVSSYSPAGSNINAAGIRTPEPTMHWHQSIYTPNAIALGPIVPQSTPSVHLPIRYAATYQMPSYFRHSANRNQNGRRSILESPQRNILTERGRLDTHTTPTSNPPTRFITLNQAQAHSVSPGKGIAQTRVTNRQEYYPLGEQSKSLTSSGESNSNKRRIIKLKSKQQLDQAEQVEKPNMTDSKMEGKNSEVRGSGIRVTIKKTEQSRQSLNSMPLPFNNTKNSESIEPHKILTNQINKAQGSLWPAQQPTAVSDPDRAAQTLRRQAQTPVELFVAPNIAISSYTLPNQRRLEQSIEPIKPTIPRPESPINYVLPSAGGTTTRTVGQFPQPSETRRTDLGNQQVATDWEQPPTDSQGNQHQQSIEKKPSNLPFNSGIRQTTSINQPNQQPNGLQQVPPFPQQTTEVQGSSRTPIKPPSAMITIPTPQRSEPDGPPLAPSTAEKNRENNGSLLKPTSTIINKSVSPHTKPIFPRRSCSRRSAPVEASGPFAYLMNCKDQPRAYRLQHTQQDVPREVLEAWNRQ